MKLFLRGDRCTTAKCAIEKRNYSNPQLDYSTLIINVSDSATGAPIYGSIAQILISDNTTVNSCNDCHGDNNSAFSEYPNKLWNGKYSHLDDESEGFPTDAYGRVTAIVDSNIKAYIYVTSFPNYRPELFGAVSIGKPDAYIFDISLEKI